MFFRLAYFATFAFYSSSFLTEGQPLNHMIGHKRLHTAKRSYLPQTWDKHQDRTQRQPEKNHNEPSSLLLYGDLGPFAYFPSPPGSVSKIFFIGSLLMSLSSSCCCLFSCN